MANGNFYDDRRFCASCATYVPFLVSPHASYCARCGERVALFSPDDMSRFRSTTSSSPLPVSPPGSLAVQLMAKKRSAVNRAAALKPVLSERVATVRHAPKARTAAQGKRAQRARA